MRRGGMMLFALLACSSRATQTEEPVKSEPVSSSEVEPVRREPVAAEPLRVARIADGEGFEATVRIDPQPEGKGFQGVWLERADGERLLLEYRPVTWLQPLAGRTVRVTGATHEPPGPAILATHFKVDTLWVVGDASEVPVIGFGPEITLAGTFVRTRPPAGAKNEDEWFWTFVTPEGARYHVEHVERAADGALVQVQVRVLEPSPTHAARRGGASLWVLDSTPQGVLR